jgi:hypothetical protein
MTDNEEGCSPETELLGRQCDEMEMERDICKRPEDKAKRTKRRPEEADLSKR